jgi:putative nucleotidyltransferase with HDIG domain
MPRAKSASARYVWIVVCAGLPLLAHSVWTLVQDFPGVYLFVLLGLTVAGAAARLRIPAMPISFSIADTFSIATALLVGTPGGTIAAALDGLVLSYGFRSTARTRERILFNAAAPALAMWISSTVFFFFVPGGGLLEAPVPPRVLVGPLVLFTTLCFVLNTGLVARAVALEQKASTVPIWREHFLPLGLTYLAAASMAGLLATFVTKGLELAVIAMVVPLPALVYLAFKNALGRTQDHLVHLAAINQQYLATIETLAQAIDAKDQVTHGHIRRVQRQAVRLAREIGVTDEGQIKAIEAASLLHDTGKLAIPEHILNKPGRLTPAEFDIMKRHAPIGAEILSTIDFPYPVVPIVRHHHENWDGSGYPDRLRGDQIPIGARILSVVDCFDALTSDRPYRPRLSTAAALEILRERRGWMYDPQVVDTFLRLADEFAVEESLQDAPTGEDRLAAVSGSIHSLADADRRGEADEETERLRTALAVGRALESGGGTDAAIAALLSALRTRIRVTDAALLRVNGANALCMAAAAGVNAGALRGLKIRLGEGVSGWVAANRQPMLNADPRLDLQGRVNGSGEQPQSMLAVPLVSGTQACGVLALYSVTPSAFTDADLRLATAIAQALSERLATTFAL